MQYFSEPLVINLVVYKNRDDWLYREMQAVPSKYRAERVRNLATLACLLRPLLGGLSADAAVGAMLREAAGGAGDPIAAEQGEESLPLKLTINQFNYPELYRELVGIPAGSVSSRVKVLSAAGAVLTRLSRVLPASESEGATAPQHAAGAGLAKRPQEEGISQSAMSPDPDPAPPVPQQEGGASQRVVGAEPVPQPEASRDESVNPEGYSDGGSVKKKPSAIGKIRM